METRKRKPRSDALKNRDLLIEAARDVFGKGGSGASLEAVARQAGVGIGTLYRHFPTRQALFQAVFSRDVEEIVTLAERLQNTADPVAGLRYWLAANVAMVETKRGMLGALSLVITDEDRECWSEMSVRMSRAIDRLLQRAVAEGRLKDEVSADDLLQTMYALCYAREPGPGWRQQVLRLLNIFVDGLRV